MKILITGFHHSGTSILRKVIGNHPQVYDVLHEIKPKSLAGMIAEEDWGVPNVVMKSPLLSDYLLGEIQKIQDKIKVICITRDPRETWASLKQRYVDGQMTWEIFRRSWLECTMNSMEVSIIGNGILIKYEDLFKDNYKGTQDLFKWLSLEMVPGILDTTKRRVPVEVQRIPDKEPSRVTNALYRSWQINRPFLQAESKFRDLLTPGEIQLFDEPEVRRIMDFLGYR